MPATSPAPHAGTTAVLTAAEQAFTRRHAAEWARPDVDAEQAHAYADWYLAEFAERAQSMNDLPAHHQVWGRFLDSRAATLTGRRQLCETRDVTLNGQPARISGARDDFATVRILESGLGCEWAWETAARIVAAGGEFRS